MAEYSIPVKTTTTVRKMVRIMPTVGGKKFPYTKKGIEAAKKAATKKAGPKDKKVKMGQSKRYSEGYGKEESVGNPGAGVTRRKKVSDAIRRGNMDK
jgi:hypothetical protein